MRVYFAENEGLYSVSVSYNFLAWAQVNTTAEIEKQSAKKDRAGEMGIHQGRSIMNYCALLALISSLFVGALLTGVLSDLGLFVALAKFAPELVGMSPAFVSAAALNAAFNYSSIADGDLTGNVIIVTGTF